jgi:ATP-binding cassette subfamily A (ABC1) protein 3
MAPVNPPPFRCSLVYSTPTSGDVRVYGHSVVRAPQRCHRQLGLCPQHDLLWGMLSVIEHLELYAAIRRVPPHAISSEAERVCAAVGLADKAHTAAAALSGGMQRKLSVGLALVGHARLLVLDEPSSGMDPMSRTRMWELLRAQRGERAIVLTTHYMDEADILADRIAILAVGRLECSGSSLFLKVRPTSAHLARSRTLVPSTSRPSHPTIPC